MPHAKRQPASQPYSAAIVRTNPNTAKTRARTPWTPEIPIEPRSKFAAYEEACKSTKHDPYFDRKWDYDPTKRLRSSGTHAKDRAKIAKVNAKADALEALLGL